MSYLPYQGRIAIHPVYVQLEDRDVPGKFWTLTHRASDERFGINDAVLGRMKRMNVRQYAAGEEPYVSSNPQLRFFVRGGRVGVEVIELPQAVRDRDPPPITTRVGNTKLNLQIEEGDWHLPGDVIGYGVLRDG